MTGGVALIVKPPGCSSHDVVATLRRRVGLPCGHLGTLDPLAAGLLVVAAGRTTRLLRYAGGEDKEYLAEVWLGIGTPSDDFGTPVEWRADATHLSQADVEAGLAELRRETLQAPPAYSARQVGGERAYRAARAGRPLELPMRPAQLHTAELLEFRPGSTLRMRLRLKVSAGYYVRALARDLGARLGVPGALAFLLRTASGPFLLERARTLEEEPELLPPDLLLDGLPRVDFAEAEGRRLVLGQRLPGAGEREGRVAAYLGGRLIAVAVARQGVYHPETVLGLED